MVIGFIVKSCKIENAHLIRSMIVKCRKLGPFGEVCRGRLQQLCR